MKIHLRSIVNMLFVFVLGLVLFGVGMTFERADARGDAPNIGFEGVLYSASWIMLILLFVAGFVLVHKNRSDTNSIGSFMIAGSVVGGCLVLIKWHDITFGSPLWTFGGLVAIFAIMALAFSIPAIGRKCK